MLALFGVGLDGLPIDQPICLRIALTVARAGGRCPVEPTAIRETAQKDVGRDCVGDGRLVRPRAPNACRRRLENRSLSYGGPRVRIRLPPAESPLRTGALRLVEHQDVRLDPTLVDQPVRLGSSTDRQVWISNRHRQPRRAGVEVRHLERVFGLSQHVRADFISLHRQHPSCSRRR
jgi:hypothetical protein